MDGHVHEQLLQLLSTFLIELNSLQRHNVLVEHPDTSQMPVLRRGLQELEQLAREAIALVRNSVEAEVPSELEGLTLAEALSRVAEEVAERLGISSRVSFSGVDEQGRAKEHILSPRGEHLFFLLAREALYDVEQHKETRRLRLTLTYREEDVHMSIEDDGISLLNTQFLAGLKGQGEDRSSDNLFFPAPLNDDVLHEQVVDVRVPIFTDIRDRFECQGGSLEIRALGERGTRLDARIPYVLQSAQQNGQNDSSLHLPTSSQSLQPVANRGNTSSLSVPASDSIRLLIVDNQAVTRAGLHRLLETYADLHVIGEAADGVQAVSETLELGPQVVLMDTQLPEGQSLEALRQIKQLNLDTRVLLLATQDREEYLYETLRAGADGYVLKDIDPDELARSIRVVARGDMLIQPQIAGRLISRYGQQRRNGTRYDTLTAREQEVLHLLSRGLRNKEIAARLYVSERTVNFHLANIYQKLNVSGRTEALSKAIEQGLITP